ncbi:MAG: hypothetical protein LBH89_02925 [Lactococcus lactis]|nr:hypothetical protein [Lactococcus lactis]
MNNEKDFQKEIQELNESISTIKEEIDLLTKFENDVALDVYCRKPNGAIQKRINWAVDEQIKTYLFKERIITVIWILLALTIQRFLFS